MIQKKTVWATGVLCFILFVLLVPKVVFGQTATLITPGNTSATPLYASDKTIEKELVEKPWQIAFMQVIWNMLQFVSDRLAYEFAVGLATGATGGDPLVELRSGAWLGQDLVYDVAGEAIYQLGLGLESVNIHFNLCAPGSLGRLNLQLGLKQTFRPEPHCDFSEALTNWGNAYTSIVQEFNTIQKDPSKYVLTYFANSINPRATELTASISIYSQTFENVNTKKSLGIGEWLAKNGFKDVVYTTSGQVKTPAAYLEENQKAILKDRNPTENFNKAFTLMITNKDLWQQLGVSAFNMFTNTFLSTFVDRLLTGYFLGEIPTSDDVFDVDTVGFKGGQEGAEAFYKTIYATAPVSLDTYNAVSEFTNCPSTNAVELNNCTMDTDFATAVGSADSGDPFTLTDAVEEELLHGEWPLVSSGDSRNLDRDCYSYGYCYSNLVKLRKARIIPVGWEIAAALQESSDPDTLQEVMDAFDTCNDDGERDTDHPYCHLIDPNWVLKYPSTQCKAQVPGQLVSVDGTTRSHECVDTPSCIDEDASGQCIGGYGYCMQEKNTYQFRGQSCPEYYGTCLSLANEEGDDAHLLFNTVDESVCDEESGGCLWYETVKEEGSDGVFDWPSIADTASESEARDTYKERIYFNNEVEECDSEDAGCTRVVVDDEDTELNLLMNPSFEDDEDGDSVADFWFSTGTSGYDTSGDLSLSGDAAVNPGSGLTLYQRNIPIQTSQFYTLSFYAAQASGSAANALTVYVITDSMDGSEAPDLSDTSYDSANCSPVDLDGVFAKETMKMSVTPASTDYERFTCTFTSPTFNDETLEARVKFLDFSGDVLVDAVQLEADEDVDNFREEYGRSIDDLNLAYYKLPPAYLGCEGDSDDPAECDDYAQMCTAQDAGCMLYTPVNGNPSVPGIASALDECPSECAGYDTYKQEPTRFEPDGAFPVYFIAESAVSCSEQYVGCDEFTSLADESTAYYTAVRSCVKTDETTHEAVYYTWEGSDLEGYKLQSWILIKSDVDDGPCMSWTMTSGGVLCADVDAGGDGTVDMDTSCDEHADIFEEPNCREFYDSDGDIFYRTYDDTVSVSDECSTLRKTDVAGDTDSEQQSTCEAASFGGYWDSSRGECFVRALAQESDSCPAAQNGCREYTGGAGRNSSVVYEDDAEDEDVDEYDAASADVEVSNESVATDGHSIHVTTTAAGGGVFTAYVDYGSTCSTEGGCSASDATLGFECTVEEDEDDCGTLVDALAQDKVYVLNFWAKAADNSTTIQPEFVYNGGTGSSGSFGSVELSTSWEEFTVGPFDTTDTNFDETAVLAFAGEASGDDFYIDNITLRETEEEITIIKDSWVTPATCDETEEGAASDQYQLGCAEYTDNEGETVYLKSFTRLCEEDLVGCAAFFDTHESDSPYGAVYNARCENTDEVSSATACEIDGETVCTISTGETYCLFDWEGGEPRADSGLPLTPDDTAMSVSFGPEMVTVNPDEKIYFVANSAFACDASVMGCFEAGKPTFSADQSRVDAWESTYLINQPEEYGAELCQDEALFCEVWEATDGSTYYFKNPLDKTCEYKTGVSLGSTSYSGWFKTGTSEFCYGTGTCTISATACETDADCTGSTDDELDTCEIDTGSYLSGGTVSSIWRNGDAAYDGSVGACSSQYDFCTEFIDPADTGSDLYGETEGESYFFINDELLDDSNLSTSKQCNGKVSQKRGCVLFNDILEGQLTYSATATYVRSVHASDFDAGAESYDLVDPLSCPDGGVVELTDGTEVDLCTQRCAYDTAALHPYGSETGTTYTTSCLLDTDCADRESDGGDLVSGSCETGATALEDDTNTVQKVNLDRACAQWLACDSTTTVWDTSTGSYKIRCDSVDACSEYTSLGDSTFCAQWAEDRTPQVLTASRYSARDVGWYGYEYSGYTIPNQIPAQYLSQVNVNPSKWCVDATTGEPVSEELSYWDCTTTEAEEACETASAKYECQSADEDYRLVFNAGVCDEESGASCTVGFCTDNGRSCGDDDDCETGASCAVGYCAYEPSGATECTMDADCASQTDGATSCIDSLCQEQTTDACADASDCTGSGTATCVQAAATQTGTCYNEQCLLDPADEDGDGEAEDFVPDEGEELECRGWPEDDAPFPNSVVDTWQATFTEGETEPTESPDSISYTPYERLSTFEEVNWCAAGEACDCSYDKVSYGTNTTTTRYYDQSSTDAASYICVGGTFDGAECSPTSGTTEGTLVDDTTKTCGEESGGTCELKSELQTVVGWQGYCLERDLKTPVNGDTNENACLTWLPVDQLAGSSDIYGKYTEAGYALTDAFYCGGSLTYIDIPASDVACAEHETTECEYGSGSSADWGELLNGEANAYCPQGSFAVMGRCIYQDATDSYAGGDSKAAACESSDGGVDGANDHPYICVPKGSLHTTDNADGLFVEGDKCYTPAELNDTSERQAILDHYSVEMHGTNQSDWDYENETIDQGSQGGNQVYRMQGSPTEFDDFIEGYYSDCELQGDRFASMSPDPREIGQSGAVRECEYCVTGGKSCTTYETCTALNDDCECATSDPDYLSSFGVTATITEGTGWYDLAYSDVVEDQTYVACSTLVQVASTDEGNAAWTDRVLFRDASAASPFAITDPDGYDQFEYVQESQAASFGEALSPETLNSEADPDPARLLACQGSLDTGSGVYYGFGMPTVGETCDDGTLVGSSDHEARSYQDPIQSDQVTYISLFTTSDTSGTLAEWSTDVAVGVADRLSQIFANFMGVASFSNTASDANGDGTNDTFGGYGSVDTSIGSGNNHYFDVRATGDGLGLSDSVPSAPIVRSVSSICVDDQCQEGPDGAFSVNGLDEGTLTGEDSYLADVKFYVEANENQMPIRRMIVDWQDDPDHDDQTGSTSSDNYYKNARGLDATSEEICGNSPENWGEESDACTSSYYNYTHTYTCSEGFLQTLESCSTLDGDGDGLPDSTPCSDGSACVYRPRIHVRDNWGWCTGTCPDTKTGVDGTDGCFDGDGDGGIAVSSSDDDECDLKRPDNTDETRKEEDDPWVYFNGVIQVDP